MPNEELVMLEDNLRLKWVKLKIRLTDKLLSSMDGLDQCENSKDIKCLVDSLAVMEKLVGVDAEVPEDLDQGIKTIGKRTKNIAARLNLEDSEA